MIVIVIMTARDKFFANGMMLFFHSLMCFSSHDNKLSQEKKMIEQMQS